MSTCSRCGAQFFCAIKDADPAAGFAAAQPCWCTYLPAALPVPSDAGASYWCPACLRRHIVDHPQTPPAAASDNGASSSPSPAR